MGLSSLGVGSGLDAAALVQSIMKAEQVPLNSLNNKKVDLNSKLTVYSQVKTNLSQFQSAIAALSTPQSFQNYSLSSNDPSSISSSISGKPVPGFYSVEVNQLAQGQKLIGQGQASVDAVVGTGTVSFSFGSVSGGTLNSDGKYQDASFTNNGSPTKTITIDSSNNTLVGIRNAINASGFGVTASIVNDGSDSPYHLVITNNQTGETQSMKISVGNQAAGSTGLSDLLNYDPSQNDGQAFSQSRKAQNANVKVDGISISKPSNTITDAIEGVSLTLNKVNTGNPSSIYISKDTSALSTKLQTVVSQYNSLVSFIDTQTKYDVAQKKGATLYGEASLKSIKYQIRSLLTSVVPQGTGKYTSLSQLGIAFQKDGTLALDASKMQAVLDSNSDEISKLFAPTASSTDSQIAYTSASNATKTGTYAVNVTQLATQGSLTAAAPSSLTINYGVNDSLAVSLNGLTATVNLASGTYSSIAALASEIQSKINGYSGFANLGYTVTVSVANGLIKITSNRFGASSTISLAGNGADSILGGTGVETAGANLIGKINGKTATANGQSMVGDSGDDSEGLSIKVTGGSLGDRGSVSYSSGIANNLNQMINTFTASNGLITARTDGINTSIKKLNDNISKMQDRLSTKQKYYENQFSKLDSIMSQMNSTSTSLTQQLNSLPNSNTNKNK
jgi:flagellar hook-associated protein 2